MRGRVFVGNPALHHQAQKLAPGIVRGEVPGIKKPDLAIPNWRR
jgi:hypothetical protein